MPLVVTFSPADCMRVFHCHMGLNERVGMCVSTLVCVRMFIDEDAHVDA